MNCWNSEEKSNHGSHGELYGFFFAHIFISFAFIFHLFDCWLLCARSYEPCYEQIWRIAGAPQTQSDKSDRKKRMVIWRENFAQTNVHIKLNCKLCVCMVSCFTCTRRSTGGSSNILNNRNSPILFHPQWRGGLFLTSAIELAVSCIFLENVEQNSMRWWCHLFESNIRICLCINENFVIFCEHFTNCIVNYDWEPGDCQ